jgi:hypothetical protein
LIEPDIFYRAGAPKREDWIGFGTGRSPADLARQRWEPLASVTVGTGAVVFRASKINSDLNSQLGWNVRMRSCGVDTMYFFEKTMIGM